MKRVAVVHEDGRVLRTYDIDLGDLDREPQVHWYFKQARENAIADKLVAESEANRIRCRFVDDLGEEKASERLTSNTEPTHLGWLAKNLAWAALIAALIAAVWAIVSIGFSSS
jgi:hypothetical protein